MTTGLQTPIEATPGSHRARLARLGTGSPASWAAASAVLAFACGALVLLWGKHDRPVLHLDVAFSQKACCSWQVWVQGIGGDLTVLPLQAGTERVYSVPVYRPTVRQLFVTLGSQPGGSAIVKRIWITRGSRTVSELSAGQLRGATVYQAERHATGAGLELSSTGAQPAIAATVSLTSGESGIRLLAGRAVSQRLIALPGLLLAGCAAIAILAVDRRRGWSIAAAVAATVAGVSALPWLSRRFGFRDDVSQAVGYASYVGLWKSRERFIVDMALVLAAAAATVAAVVFRRRNRAKPPVPPREDLVTGVGSRTGAAALVGIPVAIVALSASPNLRLYIGPPPKFVPSWDANNFIFWQYLIQKTHLEPTKDFYWLYGFQWVFDKAPPWGLLASYGWFLTFWAFLALGVYVSLGRFFGGWSFVLRYAILTGLWLTAFLTADLPFATRYVGPLGVVLLFAGIDGTRDTWWSWRRVVFSVALFDLTVFEVAQAGYTLVPIAFLLIVELVLVMWPARSRLKRWALASATTVGVPLIAAALVYELTGTAAGTVSLYRALTFSSSAYAFPSDVNQWVSRPTTLEGVIFWSVPVTIAVGLAGLLSLRDRFRLSYAVVTALGLLGFMIMQKQILRPHIATQVWLPMVFGLGYWAVTDTMGSNARRWSGVLGLAGALAALALVSGGYRAGWHTATGGPTRIRGTVHALVHDRATFARQAREQFSAGTFANFSDDWPVVRALEHVPAVQRGAPVWILGDDSAITMMLGRSWPYYFNDMYDASPIAFQKKLLRLLAAHPPARVVWNFSAHAMVFDAVPMPVRVPLLYAWSVRNLVPARRIGTFEILRARQPGEPVALAWWRRRIGVRIDLGHIPDAASLPSASCKAGRGCAPYLVAQLGRGAPRPPQVVVQATVDGLRFEIAFEPGPGSQWVVPLDRVWFWAASTGAHRVDLSPTAGVALEVVNRRANHGVLY